MNKLKNTLIIMAFGLVSTVFICVNPAQIMAQSLDDSMYVWYGNLNDSPIEGNIDSVIDLYVYIKTTDNAYVANICLPTGFNKSYIDTMFKDSCEIYYPLTEWDEANFYTFNDEFQPGWNSLTFLGFADLGGQPNPWLNLDEPTQVLKLATKSVNDPSLPGNTVEAYGPGLDRFQGPANAGDTAGDAGYTVAESFCLVHFNGSSSVDDAVVKPESFALMQNYPNPFNMETTISYSLPEEAVAVIDIYDVLGQKVETLVNQQQPAGQYRVVWHANDKSSGVYFYKIQAGKHAETKRMVLLK
ncbi:MAG: T9SS type A sorting domain-containing protein [candidate division Zixibacteria bacterium]|nr:T9SS type A sorting domain-containing protein [candidate division Zixibacteria bacterium]